MFLAGLEEHNYVVDAQKNSQNDAVIVNTTHTCIFYISYENEIIWPQWDQIISF